MLTGKTDAEKTLSVEPAWRELLAPRVDFQAANRPAVAALLAELGRRSRSGITAERDEYAGDRSGDQLPILARWPKIGDMTAHDIQARLRVGCCASKINVVSDPASTRFQNIECDLT